MEGSLRTNNTILVLGAHPDDIEFAMGATLSKLKRNPKNYVYIVVFSSAMQIPENKHILNELRDSMKLYNIDYEILDFRTRMFIQDSPEIQDKIYNLKQCFHPSVVYSPSPNALHPDHAVIGKCVVSVFQETSILVYEDIRGNHHQLINYWHEVSSSDVKRKISSLKRYRSQFNRKYFNFDQIYHLISARGLQIGKKFAEGFENLRVIDPQ